MDAGQNFEVHAGDNPPVTFRLRAADPALPPEQWPTLDLALLAEIEWGMSPMPGAGIRDPQAVLTKRLSTGGIVVEDPGQGIVRLVLTAADLDVEPGRYAHQLRGAFAAGHRDTLAAGTVTIKHSPL